MIPQAPCPEVLDPLRKIMTMLFYAHFANKYWPVPLIIKAKFKIWEWSWQSSFMHILRTNIAHRSPVLQSTGPPTTPFSYVSSASLFQRWMSHGLLQFKCSWCVLTWSISDIPLQLVWTKRNCSLLWLHNGLGTPWHSWLWCSPWLSLRISYRHNS